jgi:hydrogenase maturation factor
MCLAMARRVVEVLDATVVVVDHVGTTAEVSLLAADGPVHAGDWVLVHSGFVLGTVPADEVRPLVQAPSDGGSS